MSSTPTQIKDTTLQVVKRILMNMLVPKAETPYQARNLGLAIANAHDYAELDRIWDAAHRH